MFFSLCKANGFFFSTVVGFREDLRKDWCGGVSLSRSSVFLDEYVHRDREDIGGHALSEGRRKEFWICSSLSFSSHMTES